MIEPRRALGRARTCVPCLGLAGCDGVQAALDPAGPGAARIGDIWWLMFFICGAVFLAVMAVLVAALARRRRPASGAMSGTVWPDAERERGMSRIVGASIATTVVIVCLFVLASFWIGRALVAEPSDPALRIDVTAQRWWWDVRYHDPIPSKGFTTANEIHVPIGRPVELTLRSVDVIHSFWVPNVHGKKDLIPGQINTLYLQADRPGTFRGQCAEFCGLQHAHMALYLVAQPEDEFARWQEQQRRPAPEPGTDAQRNGRQVFMARSCVLCHAINGTNAGGVTGPNLTHVASRLSLAAGTLANSRENLASWIIDPHVYKPGNNMPPNPLSPDELEALLSYLGTLR